MKGFLKRPFNPVGGRQYFDPKDTSSPKTTNPMGRRYPKPQLPDCLEQPSCHQSVFRSTNIIEEARRERDGKRGGGASVYKEDDIRNRHMHRIVGEPEILGNTDPRPPQMPLLGSYPALASYGQRWIWKGGISWKWKSRFTEDRRDGPIVHVGSLQSSSGELCADALLIYLA